MVGRARCPGWGGSCTNFSSDNFGLCSECEAARVRSTGGSTVPPVEPASAGFPEQFAAGMGLLHRPPPSPEPMPDDICCPYTSGHERDCPKEPKAPGHGPEPMPEGVYLPCAPGYIHQMPLEELRQVLATQGLTVVPAGDVARAESFEQAWARMEAEGYQYGPDALEQVRFGWELARRGSM